MMTPEFQAEMREMIADILALEPQEVQPHSRFFQDLGGESLDALDLQFQVEKRFGVKAPFQQIVGANAFVTDDAGLLTGDSLRELKQRAPFFDFTEFEQNPHRERITELFTVRAIEQCVAAAMGSK